MSEEIIISVRNLRKEYPNVTPLKDVNCDIRKGEVISIIGPSGTGKSTFLRCLNRLENPTSGEITVHGVNTLDKKTDIFKVREKMGMVFQNFNLFSHLTIIENIMLAPMSLLGVSKQEAYDEGMRLLRMVGLAEKALNYPSELSGGQKQRVAIARTLAMKTDIILFDEPTSALDPTMVGEVLAVIKHLAEEGYTMLIVTHEMKFAHDVSTRIFYMDEGIIYDDGTPHQIFDNPTKEKTRAFVKRLKTHTVEFSSKDYDLYSAINSIEDFARRIGMEKTKATLVQLACEELCCNQIIPTLGDNFSLQYTINYLETDNVCEISACLSSEGKIKLNEADDLSTLVFNKIAKDLKIEEKQVSFKL